MSEKQLCPRRDENPGPWTFLPDKDTWEPASRREEDKWKENWPWVPRQCSYCGSLHPDDVIKLLQEGWEYDLTTKRYKIYLHAPGARVHHQEVVERIGQLDIDNIKDRWNPFVKVYLMHFSEEQLNALQEQMTKDKNVIG